MDAGVLLRRGVSVFNTDTMKWTVPQIKVRRSLGRRTSADVRVNHVCMLVSFGVRMVERSCGGQPGGALWPRMRSAFS